MAPMSSFQTLMLPHQYADTVSAWARFRQRHHENFLHAANLRNLVAQRINEMRALAIATTDDRETRVALKICAKKFKGLVGKKTEWW
ncbi:MAG: hypothetical protein L6R42_004801 [Xanthoria sp. 1 TBL-2021]|nr:MAG: hypothetical protein L6R42_004801 [Xanthoria sp. 1 TBL-2021]